MNWGRIKTILILLFLVTDIFLAFTIRSAENKEKNVTPEVINAACEILSARGISADKSVIPSKIPSLPVLQADNAVTAYGDFAELILGEGAIDAADGVYRKEDALLTFSGDSFTYENKKELKEGGAVNPKELQNSVFRRLAALGFDLSDARVIHSSAGNGLLKMTIRDYYKKTPVFSSELTVTANKDGIAYVSGRWYNKRPGGQSNLLKSTAAVLVDFAADYNGETPVTISSVELGYNLSDSEVYHKSASLIPVNRIILDSGKEYIKDARSEE